MVPVFSFSRALIPFKPSNGDWTVLQVTVRKVGETTQVNVAIDVYLESIAPLLPVRSNRFTIEYSDTEGFLSKFRKTRKALRGVGGHLLLEDYLVILKELAEEIENSPLMNFAT